MTLQMALLLAFTIVSLISITIHAETRVHGLNNQNPVALSPQAFEFFHPKSLQPNAAAGPSLPLAASVESTPAHESVATHEKKHMGAGAIAAIPLGFVFVGLIAMGAYYVVSKRRANLRRASAEQPLQA